MKLKKLNMRGFSHDILIVAFVVVFAIIGVGYIIISHAASCPPVSGPTSGAVSSVTSGDCTTTTRLPLYRLYNVSTGQHFYTSNSAEEQKTFLAGWKYEGITGYLANAPGKKLAPLYRLNSAKAGHFYTADANEEIAAVRNGYTYEGVTGYISTRGGSGLEALHRLLNPTTGQHFYTTSLSEKQSDIKAGWKNEGVTGYLWTTP